MAEEKEKEKPIEKMTVKELRVLAKELGAESVSAMQKEELIEFIKKVRGEPAAPKKKVIKKAKKALDVKEIKAKIKELKAQREELLAKGEKEKAALLRKRISRLKKLSRRAAKLALQTS
ncbi:MAG TPA: transcription termination factor Rho [Deltaproteobacteria bacterium]|nr:transcription termination factor Rho [Deltaproteobacteria bacterium]